MAIAGTSESGFAEVSGNPSMHRAVGWLTCRLCTRSRFRDLFHETPVESVSGLFPFLTSCCTQIHFGTGDPSHPGVSDIGIPIVGVSLTR